MMAVMQWSGVSQGVREIADQQIDERSDEDTASLDGLLLVVCGEESDPGEEVAEGLEGGVLRGFGGG